MTEKLKPCPFCLTELVENTPDMFEHEYNECTLEGHIVYIGSPFDVVRWNNRPDIRCATIEECGAVVNNILANGLYDGPYPQEVCDVVAGVLESCKAQIIALSEEVS